MSARQPIPGFGPDRCAMYLAGTEGAPPRAELVRAIQLAGPPASGARALDLGCGPGRETAALLRAGWQVTAVDPYPVMLERTRAMVGAELPDALARLSLIDATLEELAPGLAPACFGLVHAGFVLPFVRPAAFDAAFARLRYALAPGGVLACQFFGPDDEFIRSAAPGEMSSHTTADVDRLLAGLEIIHREEVNREGQVGKGRIKWWHVHHVIARTRSA